MSVQTRNNNYGAVANVGPQQGNLVPAAEQRQGKPLPQWIVAFFVSGVGLIGGGVYWLIENKLHNVTYPSNPATFTLPKVTMAFGVALFALGVICAYVNGHSGGAPRQETNDYREEV